MAKNKLFDHWTWKRTPPEPFNDSDLEVRRSDVHSKFSPPRTTSTIHAATLSGILAYMRLDHESDLAGKEEIKGGIGTQSENLIIAEYPSHTGETHIVVFNSNTGKFMAAKMSDANDMPKPYVLKETGNSGAALFFALMPLALKEPEFMNAYAQLWDCYNSGFSDMDAALKCAAVCCDNLYRRIENAVSLGTDGIKLNIPTTGNIQSITPLTLSRGTYNPTSVLVGSFQIMEEGKMPVRKSVSVKAEDFEGQYAYSENPLSAEEELMVPHIPAWYTIPDHVVSACKHIKATTDTAQPMRTLMFRGPAGTGKTEGVKALAAGLHKPYTFITCNANYEIYDFLGQMMPDDNSSHDSFADAVLPSLQDIQMDPPSAYYQLTGEYNDEVTDSDVFDKLLEVMAARAQNGKTSKSQSFHYVDTPLVKAFREGYVCEVQERATRLRLKRPHTNNRKMAI